MSAGPLRRFWIELDIGWDERCPRGVREGVGVTAVDGDDARAMVRARVFGDGDLPPVRRWVDDVAATDLCPWLVLPNMIDWTLRGVWFPVIDGCPAVSQSRQVR